MALKDYSTTAASNTSLFPEGMSPADVNNGMRQVQADIRSWYESPSWRDLGNSPTYASASTFTISGDVTATYIVGTRIRCYGTTMGTLYGTIASSSYSAPNTTVGVTLDSGTLTSNLSAVALGVDITGDPISGAAITNLTITNANLASSVISGQTEVTPATGDTVLIGDASDSNNLKKATVVNLVTATLLDEDNMASDSATRAPSQQSVKAYVDAREILVQEVVTELVNSGLNTTSNIPFDGTIPQNTEGAEVTALATSITPVYADSIIEVEVFCPCVEVSTNFQNIFALFKDSVANAWATSVWTAPGATYQAQQSVIGRETAGSTTARTYKIRFGASSGTSQFNRSSSTTTPLGANTLRAYMRVREWRP